MPFGADFETNIGNRDFNVINCHRLYPPPSAKPLKRSLDGCGFVRLGEGNAVIAEFLRDVGNALPL